MSNLKCQWELCGNNTTHFYRFNWSGYDQVVGYCEKCHKQALKSNQINYGKKISEAEYNAMKLLEE